MLALGHSPKAFDRDAVTTAAPVATALATVPGFNRVVSNALVGKTRVWLEELSGERLHARG